MEKYFLNFINFQKEQIVVSYFERERMKEKIFSLSTMQSKIVFSKTQRAFSFYETKDSIYFITSDQKEMDIDFKIQEKKRFYYLISYHLFSFYLQYFQIHYRDIQDNNIVQKNFSIQCIQALIESAVCEKGSDIHFEIFEEYAQIRFRIDGKLKIIVKIPSEVHVVMISQVKILSKLNIVEKRLPQDGSFSLFIKEQKIDFRVSVLPNIYGEKLVIRILDRNNTKFQLKNLGFNKEQLFIIKNILSLNSGMILNCGPTGSGKTTTLYSFLQHRNKQDVNIVTIEDPVEYHLDGITQIACREEIGLTFSVILRSLLRQDPDIIMIGEIRDNETAELAIKATLTGHLVFSSIHAKNSIQCIDRLCNLGISSFLIASSLRMILSQRLLRKNCSFCKIRKEDLSKNLPLIDCIENENILLDALIAIIKAIQEG